MDIYLGICSILLQKNSTYTLTRMSSRLLPFPWIWSSKCRNKLRIFAWLLLMDRLNTRNILKRKNFTIQDSNYNCVLCSTILKKLHITSSLDVHLVKNVGRGLVCKWNSLLPFYDMLSASKISFHKQFFMEVFIISTWCIWKQRNGFVFDNRPPTIDNWKSDFIDECFLQAHRFCQNL